MKNITGMLITVPVNTSNLGSIAPKKEIINSIEPDYYLHSLERYVIICYKKLGDHVHKHAFAWQIVENSKTFMRFDEQDRHFLESLAIRENQDDWYRTAGQRLTNLGFEKCTDSSSIL